MLVSTAVAKLFDLIMLVLLIQVLLSWFPGINWYNEPFKTLRRFSDAVFSPFRKIIPPIGMVDISPIVAFIVLDLIKELLVRVLVRFGF